MQTYTATKIIYNNRHIDIVISFIGEGEPETHKFDSMKRADLFIKDNNLLISLTQDLRNK